MLSNGIHLKLPPRTVTRRSAKVIQACVFYCYGGVDPETGALSPPNRVLSDVARKFKLTNFGIENAAKNDGWKEHATEMDLILARQSSYSAQAISAEIRRQEALVPKLETQHQKAVESLLGMEVGSREYAATLASASKLRLEIEAMRGMDIYRAAAKRSLDDKPPEQSTPKWAGDALPEPDYDVAPED